ncbi:MAG TPA: histidine phosphatase family protein [Myxococcaceae bacterium]|nr:histidine phosphatase family protein [Myxococcaceae bacterium]
MDWEPLGLRVRVPSGVPLALLLRHAERPPLPPHEPGTEVALTAAGREACQRLGQALGHQLLGLNTSPVPRCLETAEILRAGAGASCPVVQDRMLGDPGVFVVDPKQAWTSWLGWGADAIARALMTGHEVPPGFAEPGQATRALAAHLSRHLPAAPGVHVFVTHDTLLGPFVAQGLGRVLNAELWPGFLHGALLWRDGAQLVLAYREWAGVVR